MQTRLISADKIGIREAAALLKAGEVVAFPTETVYGLGANALSAEAVRGIFIAKGRPADNPLITHISSFGQLEPLCHITDTALLLARAFWPGPLTLVLQKKAIVPDIVTAGMDTMAVRLPSHPVARALIDACGLPLAAPSANRSGKPSPTKAEHVLHDMNGRIPLILDGGSCGVGVESTVVSLTDGIPTVLRPGGITPDMIRSVAGNVCVADSVMRPLHEGEIAPSPGMKHKHYAPEAKMTVVRGGREAVAAYIRSAYDREEDAAIFAYSGNLPLYGNRRAYDLGADAKEAAQRLFTALREADESHITRIFAEALPENGVGLAVMNRMARAAGFDIIDV